MQTKVLTLTFMALILAPPAVTQTKIDIGENVTVISLPPDEFSHSLNLGVVEFGEFLLAVDVCGESEWEILDQYRQNANSKPAHWVLTLGNRAGGCYAPDVRVSQFVSSEGGITGVSSHNVVFPSDVVLDDGDTRAVLSKVAGAKTAPGWTITVGNSLVLFAGDLVGNGRGAAPMHSADWIQQLHRLERLHPDIVVPGSGPIGESDLLRTTRLSLMEAKGRISSLVDEERSREDVIEAAMSVANNVLTTGTIEYLYDEHTGVLPATAFVEQLGLREGPSPTAASPGWTAPTKVVVADLWPGRTRQLGRVAPGVELVVARDREHAADLVEDADAILGWLTPEILERGSQLRWVSLYSAGIESYLELPGFRDSDVVLTNGRSLYANGGAEHVIAMTLALSRRLHTAVHLQSERRWDTSPLTGPTPITGDGSELGELRGKTILVAGLGGIGTEVARLAHGIGMHVLATRATRREGPPFVEYVGLSHELISLAPQADVIVNCLPLTPETERTFNEEFFSVTKPTAFYVNIGRGKTVDTDALVRALREGKIAGAGLDVTEPEPLPSDHELWGLPNVIITPHVGGDSERHMERIWLLFRENLRRFAVGEPLLSVVNKRRGY
jgi:phosphoglycerate dehydrogenase-like enzyme